MFQSFLGEMSGDWTISRKLTKTERASGRGRKNKNKRGAYRKRESNDSPEILDRGVDIRCPWPSFGAFTCKLNQFTFIFQWNKPPKQREARKYAALVRSRYKCRSVQPNLPLYKYRSVKPNLPLHKYRSVKPNLPVTDSTATSSAEHHTPGWGGMRMITFYPADSWAKSTYYQQTFPAWI